MLAYNVTVYFLLVYSLFVGRSDESHKVCNTVINACVSFVTVYSFSLI